jgi:hypothetical protein
MRILLSFIVTLFSIASFAQGKYDFISFNQLTEIKGTPYVYISVDAFGKMEIRDEHLLFVDTRNGQNTPVEFPNHGYFSNITQIKIDTLGINVLIVDAKTNDLNGKKGIDWNDPRQVIALSTDGKTQTPLTDSKLFTTQWIINHQTGAIVITGYYDSNSNNKHDSADKNEISIYDLKTLKLVSKI